MQTLRHDEMVKDYSDVIQDLQHQLGEKITGVNVEVRKDFKAKAVELIVNNQAVLMTLPQVRDLVKELKRAVNFIQRSQPWIFYQISTNSPQP